MGLFSRENLLPNPVAKGDAGVILKADGSFQVFNTSDIDPENMTTRQIEQGTALIAFAAALKYPAVMEGLLALAERHTPDDSIMPARLDA
jgi:hypothetical protein